MQDKDLSTLRTFKRLFPMIKPYISGLFIAGIALIINALTEASLLQMLKPLLDDGFGKADIGFLRFMAVMIIALIFLRGLSSFVASYCLAWVSGKVVMQMRRKLFRHLMFLPVSFFDQHSTGSLLSRITYDSEQVANSSSHALATIVRETVYIISLLGVMFLASWQFSLALILIAPIIAILIRIVSKIFRRLSKNMQDTMGHLTTSAEQMLKGHRVVLAFGGQAVEEARFNKVSNDMRMQGMRLLKVEAISNPVIEVVASFALAAILYLATVPEIMQKHLTAGDFTVIFSSMLAMMRPLKSLTNVNASFQRGMAACQTLFAIMDLPPEKDKGKYEVVRAKGQLEFKQVNFSYHNKEARALHDICFEIPQGKTVALVGHSGSGKSTLANLVTRFYEVEEGEILLDGVNIKDYKLHNLRQNCAVVSQQVHLFNDTIANNIAYAATDKYSREQIIEAARAAHALEFIEQLENGFDTIIGENGMNLSGGQRQRLAIARALLRDSPVLIFDEATSALDTQSERAIQAALEALQKDRTVLVIAHRLSTIEKADEILLLDHGRIIERGTHQELLAQNGQYKKMHSMQFSD